MARPTKQTADWWKHPSSFRNDRKIRVLRQVYGSAIGYSVYNMLLETLLESPNFEIIVSETELLCLSSEYQVDVSDLAGVIKTSQQVGLLTIKDNRLRSPLLDEALQALLVKRSRDKARLTPYRDEKIVFAAKTSENGREYPAPRENSDLEAIFDTSTREPKREPTELELELE